MDHTAFAKEATYQPQPPVPQIRILAQKSCRRMLLLTSKEVFNEVDAEVDMATPQATGPIIAQVGNTNVRRQPRRQSKVRASRCHICAPCEFQRAHAFCCFRTFRHKRRR